MTTWVSNPFCYHSLHLTTSINISDLLAVIKFLYTFYRYLFYFLFTFIYSIPPLAERSTDTLCHIEQCLPTMSNRSCWHMFWSGLFHIYIIIIYIQKFIVYLLLFYNILLVDNLISR